MDIIQAVPPKVSADTDVAIDTEFFGMDAARLHRPHGSFASMQICTGEDVYIILEEKDIAKSIKNIWGARTIIFQNATFDIRQLRMFVELEERPIWDTMVMERVLWGGYFEGASLADLARRYLNIHLDKDTRTEFSTSHFLTQEMLDYAARDADITLRVMKKQEEEALSRQADDLKVYWDIESPAIWTFMDFLPVKVDAEQWLVMAEKFKQRGEELQAELGFNVLSGKQIAKRFNSVKFPVTSKGNPSTGEEELENMRGVIDSEIIDKILLTRHYRKASSTYGAKWIQNFVEEDGLVYSDFHVIGTETGRPSCSNPNLLNIPSNKIPEYRDLFISAKGKLIVADISAQEPRCLAYLSKDKNLIDMFQKGLDVHLEVARAIYDDPSLTKRKDKDKRDVGKTINLATSYGLTEKGLSTRLNIPMEDAEKFMRNYFKKFPGVQLYIIRQRQLARRLGYVETIYGRRVWMNRHNFQSENNAINAPIQGSSADFSKYWMNLFRAYCKQSKLEFPVCNMVYDELVCDVQESLVETYKELLLKSFHETAEKLFPGIPFELEIGVGDKWSCK